MKKFLDSDWLRADVDPALYLDHGSFHAIPRGGIPLPKMFEIWSLGMPFLRFEL